MPLQSEALSVWTEEQDWTEGSSHLSFVCYKICWHVVKVDWNVKGMLKT